MTPDSPHTLVLMLNKYCRVMHWCWSTPMPREPVLRNICSDPRASIPQLAVLPGPFQQDLGPTDSPRSLLFARETGSLARVKGRLCDNVLFTCISSSSSFFTAFRPYSLHSRSLAHIFLFFSTSLRIFWPLPYRTRGGEPRKYSWNIARVCAQCIILSVSRAYGMCFSHVSSNVVCGEFLSEIQCTENQRFFFDKMQKEIQCTENQRFVFDKIQKKTRCVCGGPLTGTVHLWLASSICGGLFKIIGKIANGTT